MMLKHSSWLAATVMFAVIGGRAAHGVVIAMDSAAGPAYAAEVDGAWKGVYDGDPPLDENPPGMDNGGMGFLPWNFSGGYYLLGEPYDVLNHFIDGVDFPTTSFNNLGAPAFGLGNIDLGASAGITTTAKRPFSQPLAIGDVFSADFDTPAEYVDLSPDDGGSAGYPFAIIGFSGASGETFVIEAGSSSEFGDFPWRYDDAGVTNGDFGVAAGAGSIAPTATSDGSSLSLEITGANTGRFTFDGVSLDISFMDGLPTGVFFILYDNDADDDGSGNPTGEHAFYFDNLKIESGGGSAIPGDFDDDGAVDGDDLAQWKGDFGGAGSDADDDGDSDGNDFLIWQRNLGMPGAASSVAAVPEPASLIVALACWALIASVRDRRSVASRRRLV